MDNRKQYPPCAPVAWHQKWTDYMDAFLTWLTEGEVSAKYIHLYIESNREVYGDLIFKELDLGLIDSYL